MFKQVFLLTAFLLPLAGHAQASTKNDVTMIKEHHNINRNAHHVVQHQSQDISTKDLQHKVKQNTYGSTLKGHNYATHSQYSNTLHEFSKHKKKNNSNHKTLKKQKYYSAANSEDKFEDATLDLF